MTVLEKILIDGCAIDNYSISKNRDREEFKYSKLLRRVKKNNGSFSAPLVHLIEQQLI